MSYWIAGALVLMAILLLVEYWYKENISAFFRRVSEVGIAILGAYVGFTLSLSHERWSRDNQRREDFTLKVQASRVQAVYAYAEFANVIDKFSREIEERETSPIWSATSNRAGSLTRTSLQDEWTKLHWEGTRELPFVSAMITDDRLYAFAPPTFVRS